MIRVEIKLKHSTDRNKDKTLKIIDITNISEVVTIYSDYNVAERDSDGKLTRVGRVRKHDRSLPVEELVSKAIEALK